MNPSYLRKRTASWRGPGTDGSRNLKLAPAPSRRAFLKRAVQAAGLVALAPGYLAPGSAAPASSNMPSPGPRVTLAVETSMFRRHKTPEAFRQIRETGCRSVELGAPHFVAAEASPQAISELKRQLSDAGLAAIAATIVHPLASSEDKVRREAVTRWRRSIDAAQQLGLRLVTTELTGTLAQPVESKAAFLKSMEELLPIFEQAGLVLSAEPHPGDFFEAAQPTFELLRSFGSKHLTYLHCIPHTFYLGPSIRDVIAAAGSFLTHVHVADTFRTERIMARSGVGLHLHLRPGLGEVNFRAVFDALAEINYTGHLSVQLLSHADQPAEALRKTRESLQELLGERLVV